MADNTILLKRNISNTTVPTTSDIVVGELAISAVDGKIYLRKTKSASKQFLEPICIIVIVPN